MLDLLAVCQRISTYCSVFVTCLKRITNVLSIYQRTCEISHTSAYVGAIRRSVTGPLDPKTNLIMLLYRFPSINVSKYIYTDINKNRLIQK